MEKLQGQDSYVKSFFNQKSAKQLQALGFSDEEAQQLAWLENTQSRGKWYGLAAGLGFLYFVNPFLNGLQKKIPYLLYQPHWLWIFKGASLLAFIQSGIYFTNHKRYSANQWIVNLFSNNLFTKSKENFIQNFEVMNRQFTQAEIDQFLQNTVRERNNVQRKWIYNPNIHGDEQEWRNNIELYFKKQIHPSQKPDAKKDIQLQNQGKIEIGETLVLQPYDLTKHIDNLGYKNGVAQPPISKNGAVVILE